MQLRKHLRRVLVFAGAFVLLLVVSISAILWWMGSRSIQDWIGSQIQGVANGYLNPQLSFSNLTYTYPLDVSLKNLRLTADDPAHPGHSIDIIACGRAELALGEIPRIGKPIIIEKISLKSPLISAVSISQGSKDFVGFSNLIKGGTTVTQDKKPDTSPQKLSDVFRMRKVELIDGKIVYDPRIPGTVPMTIDQINTGLNIAPTEASWYTLSTAISRKPVFDLSVAGQFNLDSFAVRGLDLHLMTDLGQDKARFLPPELQLMLKKYQAKGKLDVAVTGDMPGLDWMHGHVHTVVKLDGANVASGDFHLPVDGVLIDSKFADGKATLSSLKIQALDGSADLTGAVTLNNSLDADLHVHVVDMVLEKLLADPKHISPAPAKLNFDFNLATSLMSFLGKAPPPTNQPLAAISLQNFRLTANDPTSVGGTIDVVACKNLDVAMTTPYIAGKPIVIDKIILEQPVLSAVAVAPGSIQFAGVPLPMNSTPQPPGPPANLVEASKPSDAPVTAPGDMLRVKEFQLNAAKIVYDPRIPNTQRMTIEPISTSLHLDPADPGTYAVNVNIGRAPVFNLAINGNINIDHPGLQKLKLNLVADLQQHQLDFLPPQLQLVLQQSHARGKLNINADASVVLADAAHGTAAFDMNVANLDFQQGDLHVPIDSLAVSAKLADGKFIETAKVATLANVFEIDGTSTLNSRLDSDVVLKLRDLNVEKLAASLHPDLLPTKTTTTLSADIELQSPAMVALSRFPGNSTDPVGKLSIHNLRMTTDNPRALDAKMDFLSCDLLEAALTSLPVPGKPIQMHHVTLQHPAIRAMAMAPESTEFAGFSQLQHLAQSLTPATTQPSATAAQPSTAPSPKPSQLFRLQSLSVASAELYYNPWIYSTVPMNLTGISASAAPDSPAGDAYQFKAQVPSDPDLHVNVSGRANVDTLLVDALKLAMDVKLRIGNSKAFPPQLQKQLLPFSPEGAVHVDATGSVPGKQPKAADLVVYVKGDNLKATANGYRIPIDHLRVPIHLQNSQATFLDYATMGGPTINTCSGYATLTGVVELDQFLTSTLKLQTTGILLQDLMATKIVKPAPDLVGSVESKVDLLNTPLLVIAAHATPPPGPNDPPVAPSPLKAIGLPANWGSMQLHMDHARLAGLEVVQGLNNAFKSALNDALAGLLNRENTGEDLYVEPRETADLKMVFEGERVHLTLVHYLGEVVGADGTGYVGLNQQLDLHLTGGPQAKLAEMGAVGNWFKQASDSLFNFHITGVPHDFHYVITHGDGKPIGKLIDTTGDKVKGAAKQGVDTLKGGFHKLFGN